MPSGKMDRGTCFSRLEVWKEGAVASPGAMMG